MQAFTLSARNTWHWRLAGFYGPMGDRDLRNGTDMCTYGRAMLRGLLGVVIITAICCLLSGLLGNTGGWLAAMGTMGVYIAPEPETIVFPFLLAIVLMFIIVAFSIDQSNKWKERRRARYEESGMEEIVKPDSAFKVWYRSFKDKTCVRLQFVDTNQG